MTTSNGGQETAADKQPQFNMLTQYIKDFSFENPNAPQSLMGTKETPKISIQIHVNASPLSDTDIEVTLALEGKAEDAEKMLFSFELIFAGVFRVQNVPKENLNPLVLIECPRLLFPFAREIIATTVRNGGFPPLLLEPVDFVSLYRQKLSQMPAADAQSAPPSD